MHMLTARCIAWSRYGNSARYVEWRSSVSLLFPEPEVSKKAWTAAQTREWGRGNPNRWKNVKKS
jgi:hypothetical protein